MFTNTCFTTFLLQLQRVLPPPINSTFMPNLYLICLKQFFLVGFFRFLVYLYFSVTPSEYRGLSFLIRLSNHFMKGHHFRATSIIRSFETRIDPNLSLFLHTSDHTYLFQSLERLLFSDLDNSFLQLFRSFFIIIGTFLKIFALRFGIFHHQAQLVCAEFSKNS